MKINKSCFILACAILLAGARVHADEIITNGGFESGFSGWTHADLPGSDGTFLLQSGTKSPVNGLTVPAPPGGTIAAMSDAQGPGSHVLYQDFLLSAPVGSAALSFDIFLGNRASGFFTPTPNTLDFSVAAFNQQARVDIVLASASPFSVSSGDVLLNLFATTPGGSVPAGYVTHSAEIASFLNSHLNTPLRLRFAETDNVGIFNFGLDNVGLQTSPVPEPSSLLMGGLGALTLLFCLRRGAHSEP